MHDVSTGAGRGASRRPQKRPFVASENAMLYSAASEVGGPPAGTRAVHKAEQRRRVKNVLCSLT